MSRGRLPLPRALARSPARASAAWTLDSLGNFVQSSDNDTTQDRTDDAANEIQTDQRRRGHARLRRRRQHDHHARTPAAKGMGLTCVYDAWDRLTEVMSSTSVLLNINMMESAERIGGIQVHRQHGGNSDVLVPLWPECY